MLQTAPVDGNPSVCVGQRGGLDGVERALRGNDVEEVEFFGNRGGRGAFGGGECGGLVEVREGEKVVREMGGDGSFDGKGGKGFGVFGDAEHGGLHEGKGRKIDDRSGREIGATTEREVSGEMDTDHSADELDVNVLVLLVVPLGSSHPHHLLRSTSA
jgi:hypothetical protein